MRTFEYEEDGKKFMSPVFIINKTFPDEALAEILKKYPLDSFEEGKHLLGDDSFGTADKIRSSKILFINEPEIDKYLVDHMSVSNWHLALRYKITGAEPTQLTAYEGGDIPGHYNWHIDGSSHHGDSRVPVYKEQCNLNETNIPCLAGTVRKISCSVILNDDYEGGEFQVRYLKYIDEDNPCVDTIDTFKPKKNQSIYFRSDLFHRVTPVTKGVRYSLVKWFGGPPCE
tara:strand:+ start:307 stop:990 length:684 start_codon:yes stop_codon:yes gene_type:complete